MSLLRFRQNLAMGMTPHQADFHSSLFKKNSKAPDYQPMADATAEAARIMATVSREQLAETKRQYNDMAPTLRNVADTQVDVMKQSAKQGTEYYDYMKETFRPVEKDLVNDVNTYNTEAERERFASEAASDVAQAESVAKGMNAREMARMGVNPNSGRYREGVNQRGLRTAAVKAGAMTGARNRARDIGYARKLDAIGVGRGLPGASSGAYNTAVNAGNSGANTVQQGGRFMLNGMQVAGNSAAQGQQMNLSGNQAILNADTSYQNTRANQTGIIDVVGMGLGAWAGSGFAT